MDFDETEEKGSRQNVSGQELRSTSNATTSTRRRWQSHLRQGCKQVEEEDVENDRS